MPGTIPQARALRARMTAARREPAYRYLMRTIEALCGEMEAPHGRVGVIGFSMGGHWAPWLAQRPELPMAATVTLCAARNGDYESSASAFLAQL